jgi:hypothetical protein
MEKDVLTLFLATIALAAAALLAGCTGASDIASTSAATSTPMISFNSDWSIQSDPIVGGSTAILHYDPARLPQCRAVYEGFPAWGITATWQADGGFARSAPVTQFANGTVSAVDATFRVPFGRDLAVWFFASDEFGCTAYDSDYGRNFHFAISAPSEPVIHFKSDWTNPVDGSLRAGADFLVDYDLLRSPYCRADYNGYQTWEVTAHARFSDGSRQDQPVTEVVGSNGRGPAPARFHAPAGGSVELWFENTDRTGCDAWDSNYSRNYRFDIN